MLESRGYDVINTFWFKTFLIPTIMASYDSDSSLEDVSDYEETSVLLGYASRDPTDDKVSHLGGRATWLDAKSKPPAWLGRCKVCNGFLTSLLQLNGELPAHYPEDERRLHVFGCRRRTCARKLGSIRAIREVRRHKASQEKNTNGTSERKEENAVPEQEPIKDLGSSLFGVNSTQQGASSNPFAVPSSARSTTTSNPFAPLPSTSTLAAKSPQPPVESFASKLQISDTPKHASQRPPADIESWPEDAALPPAYTHLYLDADYETLAPQQAPLGATNISSASNAQYAEEDTALSSALDKDTFESTLDKSFFKFSDRLAQNAEQVLRYEFKGQPLLYSGSDDVAKKFGLLAGKQTGKAAGMPRCENCGSKRVFECQLVPGAIIALEEDDMNVEDGIEWGTIILGVCERGCAGEVGEVVFREEWVGVQWEERVPKK